MNRLIYGVHNLRNSTERLGNANESQGKRENSQFAEDEIRRLFPSVRGNLQGNNEGEAIPDREYVAEISNFNLSTNYRPKRGKKKESQAGVQNKKRLVFEQGKALKEKAILKDDVLLPSPKFEDVPHVSRREELYSEKFAVSAFEIHDGLSEQEIRRKLTIAFAEKLTDLPEPKFHFVRAVGNTIIDSNCETYNGKVIKYLNKQGPVYIRSVDKIGSFRLCDDPSSDSSDNCEPEACIFSSWSQHTML